MAALGKYLIALVLATATVSIGAMEIRFEDPKEINSWRIVNDGVMGGLSLSRVEIIDSQLVFSGNVSLKNNGGFASTRRVGLKSPASTEFIRIRVKGDGKTYKLRLRDSRGWNGIAYSSRFTTEKDTWMEKTFYQSDFTPTKRGRVVPGAPPLNLNHVSQLGLMISDKQEGLFQIKVKEIEFVAP